MAHSDSVRPRPPALRALGSDDPPPIIEISGATYLRTEILKHDSVAATALYEGQHRRVVCKFNRRQSFFGIPTTWFGRYLARHERKILLRLADLPEIPRFSGEVFVDGRHVPNAVAHDYIPGHPLGRHEFVDARFFPLLEEALARMHARNVAYADMNKRENIIVGEDGLPYLIDFQISIALPESWPENSLWTRALLHGAKLSDRYHLQKHYARCRPDLLGYDSTDFRSPRPRWIKGWRLLATPARTLRRRLLVALGVRAGKGLPDSEHSPQDVVRQDRARALRTGRDLER